MKVSIETNNEAIVNGIDLIFLLDTSLSMYGERISQLNLAMAEAVKASEGIAIKLGCDLKMRVITFSTGAKWVVGNETTGVEHIDWYPVSAGGCTDTDQAINLVCDAISKGGLGYRSSVIILITDGLSMNYNGTVASINRLKTSFESMQGNNKLVRIAIGIGDVERDELNEFASKGTVIGDDGEKKEDTSLVFEIHEEYNLLNYYLNFAVTSAIESICKNGTVGGSDGTVIRKMRQIRIEGATWDEV